MQSSDGATEPLLRAPAPWRLHGRGYICMLRHDPACRARDAFDAPTLAGRRLHSPYAWMMFVDYQQSDVGPYHELLFIPGRYPFENGRRHLSISRIFVSTMDSVVNGRRNWGIPKDQAQFDVRYRGGALESVTVSSADGHIADLQFRSLPLWLPFSTALVPRSLRTLGQHHDGKTFIYTPSAQGWVKPARLQRAQVNPAMFPDLSRARPVLAVEVPRFRMTFPVSQVIETPPGQADDAAQAV